MLTLTGAGQGQNIALTLGLDLSVSQSLSNTQGVTINYTRPSRAMYFNSTGRLVASQENVFTWSEDLSNVAWAKNAGSITSYNTSIPTGVGAAWSLIEDASNNEHRISQSVGECIPARTYTFSCLAQDAGRALYIGSNAAVFGGNDWAVFDLRTGVVPASSGSSSPAVTAIGGGWYLCSVSIKCVASGSASAFFCTCPYTWNVRVAAYTGDGVSGIRITAMSANQGGVLAYTKTTTAQYYAPRYEYDPQTLAFRGIKVEGSATNLLLQSQEYSGSSWTKAAITSVGFTTDVNGVGNFAGEATKIVEDASGTAFIEQTNLTVTANSYYCASHFIRRGNFDWIRLLIQDNSGTARATVWYNINSGTVGSSGVTAGVNITGAFLDKQQDGWMRVGFAANMGGSYTNWKVTLVSAFADNNTTRVNNGYYYACGSQFEAGKVPTSYIYTRVATATRAADLINIPVGSWWNKNAASVVAEYQLNYVDSGVGYALFFASDNTSNNRVYMRANNFGGSKEFVTIVSNAITSLQSFGGIVPRTLYKVAGSYGASGFTFVADNGTPLNNPVAALPANIIDFTLGSRTGAIEFLNGWIKSFRVYNGQLADNTLKNL